MGDAHTPLGRALVPCASPRGVILLHLGHLRWWGRLYPRRLGGVHAYPLGTYPHTRGLTAYTLGTFGGGYAWTAGRPPAPSNNMSNLSAARYGVSKAARVAVSEDGNPRRYGSRYLPAGWRLSFGLDADGAGGRTLSPHRLPVPARPPVPHRARLPTPARTGFQSRLPVSALNSGPAPSSGPASNSGPASKIHPAPINTGPVLIFHPVFFKNFPRALRAAAAEKKKKIRKEEEKKKKKKIEEEKEEERKREGKRQMGKEKGRQKKFRVPNAARMTPIHPPAPPKSRAATHLSFRLSLAYPLHYLAYSLSFPQALLTKSPAVTPAFRALVLPRSQSDGGCYNKSSQGSG